MPRILSSAVALIELGECPLVALVIVVKGAYQMRYGYRAADVTESSRRLPVHFGIGVRPKLGDQ